MSDGSPGRRVMQVTAPAATCCHCGQEIAAADAVRDVGHGELRHVRGCLPWEPSGPISDGTLRCPVRRGTPCQRRIPAGWHENEGHPGGHWFEADAPFEARARGQVHTDAVALLGGRPFDEHWADQCPDPRTCDGNPDR